MADSTLTMSVKPNIWQGGFSPFRISWGKLMMWYFLVGDSFSFGAFLITYGALRFSYESWPLPTEVFKSFPFLEGVEVPLGFVSFMTFTLIMSSVTMVLAVHYGNHERNRLKVAKWLAWTIVGGLIFLSSQAWEWTHLITHGMTMKENPFGAPAFGWLFFTITGFHGFHVFTGVIINIIVLTNVLNGVYDRRGSYEMVEKVGLYWHFVDLVWVFVFMAFYLL
ncbi:MAG: cytochrome c oxidase subunit 3 [Chitinophagales bacterium]|nr:cytochrome c oxidase subunit 3 [Chitinophagales bacterium]MDW8393054.1 cytochrome c oxidase subunit 3 [Chitinophagales bacterium]